MRKLTPDLQYGIDQAMDVLSDLLDLVEDTDEYQPTLKELTDAVNRLHSPAFGAFQTLGETLTFMDSPMGKEQA